MPWRGRNRRSNVWRRSPSRRVRSRYGRKGTGSVDGSFGPRVVAAEPPQMSFGVAASVARSAVILLGVVVEDLGAGGLGPLVVRAAVAHDDVGALGLAPTQRIGLREQG